MLSTAAMLFFQDEYDAGAEGSAAAAAGLGFLGLVYFAVIVLLIVAGWKVFTKAGKPGWASIIPIYNFWVFFEIAGRPGWWCLIPLFNLVMLFVIPFDLARKFGKSGAFGAGLLFLGVIFYPILAFGDAQYNPNA